MPATPSARARSKPRIELAALTTGDTGQISIPRSVDDVESPAAEAVQGEALGNPRGQPDHPVTESWAATPIETAPPIENPTSTLGRATRSMAALASAMQEASAFHDLTR